MNAHVRAQADSSIVAGGDHWLRLDDGRGAPEGGVALRVPRGHRQERRAGRVQGAGRDRGDVVGELLLLGGVLEQLL
jgi:hypothetical protein